MVLHPPIRDKNIISENSVWDDFSSPLDATTYFPSLSCWTRWIYASQNKQKHDGQLRSAFRAAKRNYFCALWEKPDSVEARRRILEDELSRAALLIHITVRLTQQLELQSADQRGLERSTPLYVFRFAAGDKIPGGNILLKADFWGICVTDESPIIVNPRCFTKVPDTRDAVNWPRCITLREQFSTWNSKS